MEFKRVEVEETPFLDFLGKFREEELYGEKITNEIMVRDWGFDDPLDVSLVYVAGDKVAIVIIPVTPEKDNVRSYYLVENVPPDNGGIDYRKAYQKFADEIDYLGGRYKGAAVRAPIVRKDEKNSLIAIYSGLVFHEGIFKDSPSPDH